MFDSRSMSSPDGDSLHWHVGTGQDSITGTAGGANGIWIFDAYVRLADVEKGFVTDWRCRLPCRKTNMMMLRYRTARWSAAFDAPKKRRFGLHYATAMAR